MVVELDISVRALVTDSVPVTRSRSSRKAAEKQKQKTSPAASEGLVLPVSWKNHLPKEQHEWIGRALFKRDKGGRAVLVDNLQMWCILHYHPLPIISPHLPPTPSSHGTSVFGCPTLLCMLPICKRAGQRLKSCSLYKSNRRVFNLDGWYYMATEYLECCLCLKKVAAWSQDILGQLDSEHCARFPAILTYRLSCDIKVVWLMRQRSLGNSS